MIAQSQEAAANFIKPGEEFADPEFGGQKRGFKYVITSPTGEAALVAILSDGEFKFSTCPIMRRSREPKQRPSAT